MIEFISSVTIPIGYPNVSMQKSLAECDKSAYFGSVGSLQDFVKKSNWEDVQLPLRDLLYKGNETLYGEMFYIQIGVPYLQLYFEKKVLEILESGLYYKWEKYLNRQSRENILFYSKLTKLSVDPQALDLASSNVRSVFYIYLICIGICLFIFTLYDCRVRVIDRISRLIAVISRFYNYTSSFILGILFKRNKIYPIKANKHKNISPRKKSARNFSNFRSYNQTKPFRHE